MSARLLLVDDDPSFTRIASRVLTRHGFEILAANDIDAALAIADCQIDCAVIDLVIGSSSGLTLVPKLRAINPEMRILVLTGYASIATAVEAIKLGADNYLTKPANAEAIIRALRHTGPSSTEKLPNTPISIDRLEWEHIQRVLADNSGNVSATARALKMHRRTLQRKLSKKPAKE